LQFEEPVFRATAFEEFAGDGGINNYLDQSFDILAVTRQMSGMHGSISGCIYPFQFKFENFCRNSAKQATAVNENIITKVTFNDEYFMF
jgi:hypothetical protein